MENTEMGNLSRLSRIDGGWGGWAERSRNPEELEWEERSFFAAEILRQRDGPLAAAPPLAVHARRKFRRRGNQPVGATAAQCKYPLPVCPILLARVLAWSVTTCVDETDETTRLANAYGVVHEKEIGCLLVYTQPR